jgi:hypothetical protein
MRVKSFLWSHISFFHDLQSFYENPILAGVGAVVMRVLFYDLISLFMRTR